MLASVHSLQDLYNWIEFWNPVILEGLARFLVASFRILEETLKFVCSVDRVKSSVLITDLC